MSHQIDTKGSAKLEKEQLDDKAQDVDKAGKKKQALEIFLKILNLLFSTAGLFVLNCLYVLAGGFIFEYLEQYNEKHQCFRRIDDYKRAENATLTLLLNVALKIASKALQMPDGENAVTADYAKVLQQFQLSVMDIGFNISKNCSLLGTEGGPQYSWTLASSAMFAMTIVTTIGYGNIAPKTLWGRMTCIAYALLGIPLMLLCLANVGVILADAFRFIYTTVCCCGCCKRRSRKTAPIQASKQWTMDKSGRPIAPQDEDSDLGSDEDEEEEESEEKVTVPLTISILVMIIFIMGGAAIFSAWETDWGILDAAYFCFITFTTIGFGDMVPGTTNLDNTNSQIQLIVTSMYQVLGMAIITMCFQLMQDEIVAKVEWLKEKLKKCVGKSRTDEKVEEILEGEKAKQKDLPPIPETAPLTVGDMKRSRLVNPPLMASHDTIPTHALETKQSNSWEARHSRLANPPLMGSHQSVRKVVHERDGTTLKTQP